ncbi:hypothetical protein [Gloeobacter morelensis]|uniref:Uncharacterized protein n=1 Tax=Gloeobacter morelensis MG652769 TaxID=2781736 RepID=A0ABY3PRE4_9CYAN|nr:hypothetical protein [Gloeobacter morelensis]UFP96225.1 hypothetical protein ISF26_08470 [Gloeobacter morelensis MG652769]
MITNGQPPDRIERIERVLEALVQQFGNQLGLITELRTGQVVLNQQLTQTLQHLAGTDSAVERMANILGEILPVMQNMQQQMLAQQDQMLTQQSQISTQQEQLQRHQERIEDLYRAQGHILRRLFGEEQGS